MDDPLSFARLVDQLVLTIILYSPEVAYSSRECNRITEVDQMFAPI